MVDLAADVSKGPEKHPEGRQEAERVTEIDGDERPRSVDVDDGPGQQSSNADAQVDQGEVDPEVPLADGRRHHRTDHGVEARPEDAACGPEQSLSLIHI